MWVGFFRDKKLLNQLRVQHVWDREEVGFCLQRLLSLGAAALEYFTKLNMA